MTLSLTHPVSNSGQPIPLKFIDSDYSKELKDLVIKFEEIARVAIPISYTTYGYSFVMGIELFLGFLTYANKKLPPSKKILNYDDLDTLTFLSFFNWAMKKNERHYYWLKAIRVILDKAHYESPRQFKKIAFPTLRTPQLNPRSSLTDDAVNQLIDALKKNVGQIIALQELREKWRREGKILNVANTDFVNDFKLENICFEFKNIYLEKVPEVNIQINGVTKYNQKYRDLALRIKKCPDPKVNSLTPSEFGEAYIRNKWFNLAKDGRCCINQFKDNRFMIADAAKTIYESDYIFSMSKDELVKMHAQTCKTLRNDSCETNIHFIIRKFRTGSVRPSEARNKTLPLIDSDIQRYTDFLATLYPTGDEVIVILIFIMLQTGWNLETATSIDINNYEHAISKGVDSDIAVLTSVKRRGGNKQLPYKSEKIILAPSDTKDKYSAYNLYQLLFKITAIFRHGKAYQELVDELGYEPAFILLLHNYSHKTRLIDALREGKISKTVHTFLERNPIFENGKRVLANNHLLQRLRPTWERLKKKSGTSRASLSYLMGHSNHETKDLYYDNSSVASAERKDRGGAELQAVELSLRTHSFKGKLIPLRTGMFSESKKPATRDGHIFFDDVSNRLISMCNDSLSPDWDGHEKWVSKTTPCFYMHKCLLCSQARITVETLPYVVDRSRYIDSQELFLSKIDFVKLYGDEKVAIDYIIKNWPNIKDIEEAEIYVDINGPLLPADMQVPIDSFK